MKTLITIALFGLTATIAACGKDVKNEYTVQQLLTEQTVEPTTTTETPEVDPLIVTDGSRFTVNGYPEILKAAGWNVSNVAVTAATDESLSVSGKELVDPLLVPVKVEVAVAADSAAKTDSTATTETETQEIMPKGLVVYWEGFNSFGAGKTPAEAYAAFQQYVSDRHAAGFKVMVITMIYSTDSALMTAGFFSFLQTYNGLVLENEAGADFVLDLMIDPRFSDSANRTYFEADKTSLNKNGVKALAQDVGSMLKSEGYLPKGASK